MPEIFAVLEGSGEVSGAIGVDEPIGAGEAVFWHESDEQEMKSEVGANGAHHPRRECGSVPRSPGDALCT
jgi:hypothetical protein